MKFSISAVVFAFFGATSSVEGNLSMRGNTKSANELLKKARRLEDANNAAGGYSYGYNKYSGYNNGGDAEQGAYGGGYGAGGGYGGGYGDAAAQGGGYYNNAGGYYGGAGGYYGNYQQQGGGEGGEDEDNNFLMYYSIKLLSCIDGEMVMDADGDGEYERSAVIFRLCPSKSCTTGSPSSSNSNYGCSSGYGDYIIGINTFLELYEQSVEEEQEDQGNNYNNGYQNGYDNGQYNSLVTYNQYGVEFDASEYLQCARYENDEAEQQQEENGQQYNNNYWSKYSYNNYNGQQGGQNGEEAEFFIGPGCSADGTTIGLKVYYDEECMYPANVNFAKLSYGMWPSGLPFANGGLVNMDCKNCYKQNENYEWEMSELCQEMYESSASRCEQGMENRYGQNNYYNNAQQDQGGANGGYSQNMNSNACEYIETLLNRKSLKELMEISARGFGNALRTTVIVLGSIAVVVGALVLYTKYGPFFKKNKSAKSVDDGSASTSSSANDQNLLSDQDREVNPPPIA